MCPHSSRFTFFSLIEKGKNIGPNVKNMKKNQKARNMEGKKNQTGSYVEIEKCKWHGACFNYLTPPCWNWLLLLGGEKGMREFCKWDPQNFGEKFNLRHESARGAGWEVKSVRIPLWGELARIPCSRVAVPVVTRIYLQRASNFLHQKDAAPGSAVGKGAALVDLEPRRQGSSGCLSNALSIQKGLE